ncbi:hypothetical protein BU15DRAFT_81633 [Melanogaster broomeanus]|nr:hypothetical protein BU15DRAFT_81633 [Melanogaster broomeanus]
MSPASKSTTPMSSVDWTHFKMPELDSDVEDNDEVALAKAKEGHWHKVEKKCQEDEEWHLWEEEAQHRQEAEEAEQRKREECEKKKRVHKAKVQDDDKVEIIGESRSGAGPSRVSLDCLVMAIEEMSNQMGELAQAHRESMQAYRELMQASRKARRALEMFVDKATICGMPEESKEESSKEEVNKGELQGELAGLDKELAENPMSPKK